MISSVSFFNSQTFSNLEILFQKKKEEVLNARNQVIAVQQEVEVLNNKLLGVKTQREALSNQLDSERKIVEIERSKRLELGREIELTQEKCLKFEDNKLQLENQLDEQKALVVQFGWKRNHSMFLLM